MAETPLLESPVLHYDASACAWVSPKGELWLCVRDVEDFRPQLFDLWTKPNVRIQIFFWKAYFAPVGSYPAVRPYSGCTLGRPLYSAFAVWLRHGWRWTTDAAFWIEVTTT